MSSVDLYRESMHMCIPDGMLARSIREDAGPRLSVISRRHSYLENKDLGSFTFDYKCGYDLALPSSCKIVLLVQIAVHFLGSISRYSLLMDADLAARSGTNN
jgi:hypothetical protein